MLMAFFIGMAMIGCDRKGNYSQPEAMLAEDLVCPEGSKGEFNRWGGIDENGWSHSCKMTHGKYHVWKESILTIEGQFSFGKKTGKWIFRNKSGDITKTILYEDGKMVSEEKLSQ
jgi:hypothetical protein